MTKTRTILAFALAGCLTFAVSRCCAEEAINAAGQGVALSEEERSLIQGKIVHDCSEKVFWVPSKQRPLQCAGRNVQAFGFFRSDIKVTDPVALEQPFNVLIVIPELRNGYRFVRPRQGAIVLDGVLGWLTTDKNQAQEPTVEQYWNRVRQSFPEFFSNAAVEKWEFSAKFPEPQQVDFGPMDDWKKRELDRIQVAVAENINNYPLWPQETRAHDRKDVTLLVGDFSRWSGYVYVIVPEMNALLTVPFGLSPVGSDYPVEADSAKRTRLNQASPDLVQRIQKHSFERRIAIH